MVQETDLKTTQAELLKMMKEIHRLCEENGVVYSLTGGSLLGAVRHGGFIPWDDDMDIMVTRDNYRKLSECLKDDPRYRMNRGPWLQHIEPVKSSARIKPFIDVFILDGLPDSGMKARGKIFLLRTLQGMLKDRAEYEGFSAGYRICIFLTHTAGRLLTRRFKLKLYDAVSQIGNNRPSRCVSITNDSFRLLKLRHTADLMDRCVPHSFEDTVLMITEKYHTYLTVRYGDYMTPPQESERVPGHASRREA